MGVMKRIAGDKMLSGGRSGFSFRATVSFRPSAVTSRFDPALKKYLDKAGQRTRWAAKRGIKKKGNARKEPRKFTTTGRISKAWWRWLNEVKNRPASPPGSPPFTHSGLLRRAVVYSRDYTARSMLIGTTAAFADDLGQLHEYGGTRFGRRYPARPFMQPALAQIQPQLPKLWQDSIRS